MEAANRCETASEARRPGLAARRKVVGPLGAGPTDRGCLPGARRAGCSLVRSGGGLRKWLLHSSGPRCVRVHRPYRSGRANRTATSIREDPNVDSATEQDEATALSARRHTAKPPRLTEGRARYLGTAHRDRLDDERGRASTIGLLLGDQAVPVDEAGSVAAVAADADERKPLELCPEPEERHFIDLRGFRNRHVTVAGIEGGPQLRGRVTATPGKESARREGDQEERQGPHRDGL